MSTFFSLRREKTRVPVLFFPAQMADGQNIYFSATKKICAIKNCVSNLKTKQQYK